MPQRVTVQFPPDRDNDFYSRVFCWADDTLYPAIDVQGLGIIHDLDRVRETVRIDVHKRQDLGEVLGLLKKTLPQHFRAVKAISFEATQPVDSPPLERTGPAM